MGIFVPRNLAQPEVFPAEALVEKLEDLVLSEAFKGGDRLPPERVLAEQYGVGRPLVREVLRRLQERGLIISIAGRGNFVRERKLTDPTGLIDLVSRQGKVTPQQLITARSMLESEAASLAAVHRTRVDIARMTEFVDRLESTSSFTELVNADVSFHETVAIASANPVIQIMFGSIRNLVHGVVVRSLSDDAARDIGVSSHRPILLAIEKGDALEAHRRMIAHLQVAENFYGPDLQRPIRDVLEERNVASN